MSDLTSNLYLAIHARDLTGPGLLGASTRLRSFGAIGAVALAGIVGGSIKAASQFQATTQSIANNTTMGQGGLDRMRKTILALGNDSNVPLDQLGQGYMRATNLGYGAADATQILTAAMKSAASTNSNTADTTNTLASVMHEFNLQGNAAAKTMDILHLASAQGNTTLEQFTTGGNKAIAMAANLGVPLDQVTAALSAMTRHGNIANASTTIVGMLSKIVNPAKAAQKELAKLTLSSGVDLLGDFTPAGLKAKGLTGILADLKAATGGNTQEIFRIIPALRGGQAAMILTGNGAKDYTGILSSLNGVTAKSGITAKAYAATQQTAQYAFGALGNKVHILAIQLGTQLLPYATMAAQWLGSHLTGAVSLVTSHVGQFGHAVQTVSGVIQHHTALIGLLAHGLTLAASIIGPMVLAYKGYTLAVKLAAAEQGALNFVMNMNPMVRVALVAAGLAGAVIYLYTHVKGFHDLVDQVWSFLSSNFGPILTSIAGTLKTALATAVDYVHDHSKQWLDILKNVWGFLSSTFGPILKTVAGILTTVLVVEIQATIDVIKALWSWGGTLVNFWKGSLQPAIGTVAGAFSGVLKKAVTDSTTTIGTLWQKAHDLWDMLANVLKPAIQPVADVFTNVFGKALSGIADKIGGLISSFGSLLKMLGQKVSTYGLDQIKKTIDGIKAGDTGKGGSGAWGNGTTGGGAGAHKTAMTVPFIGPTRGLIAARFGAAYNHGAASPRSQQVLGFHAAHHGLTATQRRNAENIVNPGPKARNPVQNAQIAYSTDMTRWKLGQRSDGQIERDIAALAKLDPKKAGLLQAQFDTAVRHRNDAIRHAAAAAQQRTQRKDDAITHAGAVKAQHDKRMAAHQQTVNLGALYYRDNMTLQQDMRDRNFTAARQVIAAMTSIKQAMEIQHGISKSQAAQDARAFSNDQLSKVHKAASAPARTDLSSLSGWVKHWRDLFMADKKAGNTGGELADLAKFKVADLAYQKALRPKNGALAVTLANDDWNALGGALSNGLKKLTAHSMGSGFHRSVYGYTSRQQVGQGVGLGETLVTFGGRVGKDPAQQMIEKLDAQVHQLTQQNAALTALLSVAEEGRDATMRVGDLLARPPRSTPGSGIGNPLRVQGLATAVR